MKKFSNITLEQLDRLGVDESGKLYWDGKPVVTEEKISLQWWLSAAAISGALAGVVVAVVEVIKLWKGIP